MHCPEFWTTNKSILKNSIKYQQTRYAPGAKWSEIITNDEQIAKIPVWLLSDEQTMSLSCRESKTLENRSPKANDRRYSNAVNTIDWSFEIITKIGAEQSFPLPGKVS